MNFLAHQHLSYPHSQEMLGNFIGDYVKGKKYLDYPEAISKGIMLHRKIDSFTDHHPVTKACRQLFADSYGKYAGILVDMVYDYALAYNWDDYESVELADFTQDVYANLYQYYELLPLRVQSFLPKMKQVDRLQSYSSKAGLLNAIDLMTKYTSLPKREEITQIIDQNTEVIFKHFQVFYPELKTYVNEERKCLQVL